MQKIYARILRESCAIRNCMVRAAHGLHVVDGKIKSQIYLTPEQLQIIDFLDQVGRISVKDVEDIISCPRRTAQLHLQKLKKIKIIKAIGKGKSTAYVAS